jgi:predicted RNase H-like nuclease (RuvC/YqgF family)
MQTPVPNPKTATKDKETKDGYFAFFAVAAEFLEWLGQKDQKDQKAPAPRTLSAILTTATDVVSSHHHSTTDKANKTDVTDLSNTVSVFKVELEQMRYGLKQSFEIQHQGMQHTQSRIQQLEAREQTLAEEIGSMQQKLQAMEPKVNELEIFRAKYTKTCEVCNMCCCGLHCREDCACELFCCSVQTRS